MSQVGRRLAQKTSALGLAGTLALFVCSIFVLATPGTASAAVQKQFTYTCGTTGPFNNPSITVGLSAPDSVTAGQTFDLTVTIPALTLRNQDATGNVQVALTLTPTGGSLSDTTPKTGQPVPTTGTTVPSGTLTYKIAVTATTTGKVSIKPGVLKLGLTTATTPTTDCNPPTAATDVLDVPIGTGGGGNGTTTDVVEYRCVGPATTDTQDVEIKVELTMPTSAKANTQFAIKWKGTYTTGKELKAPSTGQTITPKIFAYAALSGISNLTSATGEGSTGTITANNPIPLPTTTIDVKATASAAGTVTVKPSKINFGANSRTGNVPMIECTVQNETELKSYTFTVGNGTTSPSPSPTTTTPRPTTTHTATVTVTPSTSRSSSTPTRKSQTPKAGADTGAGGMAGPDGRLFILTGTALVAAAAVGGLVMRRRSIRS
ncbi:hypothetical protein [Nonomuraea sp. NPDC049504]|uniref:hypothetical protein n=1 Tax=Nonomuraea sp. NPDC049504 TaxID=3154729 RepID=UPI003438EB3E